MKLVFRNLMVMAALLLAMSPSVFAQTQGKAYRTVMVYRPQTLFGDSLVGFKIQNNSNALVEKPADGSDWWSAVMSADSNAGYQAFKQDSANGTDFDISLQPRFEDAAGKITEANMTYDVDGWHKTNQNATNTFPTPFRWDSDTIWIVPTRYTSPYLPKYFYHEPVIRYFYFLPPDDEDWNQGVPLYQIGSAAPQVMYPSSFNGRCGWYELMFIDDVPPADVMFVLNYDAENTKVGYQGIDEDPGSPIDLARAFDSLSTNVVYFEADGGINGWSATDMMGNNSCGYPLAALIYDTDASLHGAFTCWSQGAANGTGCPYGVTYSKDAVPCIGIKKGIVADDLPNDKASPDTYKKPVYQASSGCFESAEKFNQLFRKTDGVNVQYCKDLAFSRSTDGKWEYDSYNTKDGGFYPVEDAANTDGTAGFKRDAECRVGVKAAWNEIDPATGMTVLDLYAPVNGEFAEGEKPSVWEWGDRSCALSTDSPIAGDKAPRNQHFCFETHANFRYHAGQQFSFRGDDDIWVYINNKLVVDLGGTHMAAPGFVDLDKLGLEKDVKYDIDIFFCDRRTTMSNVRIKTNMYFSQNNGLFTQPTGEDSYELCMVTGSTSSCDALLSGNAEVKTLCGAQIEHKIIYYLTNRQGIQTVLSTDSSFCKVNGSTGMVCYNGITINSGVVTVDKDNLNGLAGTYVLWARIDSASMATPPPAVRIKKFTTKTDVAVITGKASVDLAPAVDLSVPAAGVVAGTRVPVYFAAGSSLDGVFNIDSESSREKTFNLVQTAGFLTQDSIGAELLVYTSQTATTPAKHSDVFTIGAGGLCTLWVEGNYAAIDEYTYTLNVQGASSAAAKLTVRQPLLKFVDAAYAADAHHAGTGLRKADGSVEPIMMGTEMAMYLVAYDPIAPDAICSTCNFPLTGKATITPDTLIAQPIEWVDGFVPGVVAGKAAIKVAGAEPIKDPYWASFTVHGPSPKTFSPSWDSLRFKEPPVPYPVFSGMYDRNGDGYGDSLHIAYNRAFKADSIPDSLYIVWPQNAADTLRLNSAEVKTYCKAGDSIIVIAEAGRKFSTEIVTKGEGQVRSWETYMDPDDNTVVTRGYPKIINDRMAPVVAKASYIGAEDCDATLASPCRDKITLQFSETVVLDSIGAVSADSALLYEVMLIGGSQKSWQVAPEPIIKSTTDTMATLFFNRYENSGSPVAGDSIRLRGDGGVTLRLFRDSLSNYPSARQVGVRIEGVKPLSIQSVVINTLDITNPVIQARLDSAPVKVYAVPVDVSIDSLAKLYPGTVGQLIKVDVAGKAYAADPNATPERIKLYTDSRYFSNLGSYVAKGGQTIGCDDAMFKGDCLKNPAYLYVAWNMITDDKRFVGSGAYISTLQFHWTLDGRAFDDKDVTELLGVRRGSGIVK